MAFSKFSSVLKKHTRAHVSMAALLLSLTKVVAGMSSTPTFLISHLVERKSFVASVSRDESHLDSIRSVVEYKSENCRLSKSSAKCWKAKETNSFTQVRPINDHEVAALRNDHFHADGTQFFGHIVSLASQFGRNAMKVALHRTEVLDFMFVHDSKCFLWV